MTELYRRAIILITKLHWLHRHRTSYCLPQSYILIATAFYIAKELVTHIQPQSTVLHIQPVTTTATVYSYNATFKATVLYLQPQCYTYNYSATHATTVLHIQLQCYIYSKNATFTAKVLHLQPKCYIYSYNVPHLQP